MYMIQEFDTTYKQGKAQLGKPIATYNLKDYIINFVTFSCNYCKFKILLGFSSHFNMSNEMLNIYTMVIK